MRIVKAHLDITKGCQLRCVGCPNSGLQWKPEFMSPEVFKQCVGNIDVERIELFRLYNFGEPLLNPYLVEIAREVPREKCDIVEVSTNGQVHVFERIETLMREGLMDTFMLSCDGDGTPEDYERLRPPAKWDRLLKFMEVVKGMKDKTGSPVNLSIRSICETQEGRTRWKAVAGARGWGFQFRDWLPFADSVRMVDTKSTGACPDMVNEQPSLFVHYDGAAVPCCCHPRAFVMGDLKTEKFTEVWSRRGFYRTQMEWFRDKMPVCRDCGK